MSSLQGTFQVSSVSADEGDNGTQSASVTVSLSSALDNAITITMSNGEMIQKSTATQLSDNNYKITHKLMYIFENNILKQKSFTCITKKDNIKKYLKIMNSLDFNKREVA